MITKHSFHVHFVLKKTTIRKDKKIAINARIKVDGKPAEVSTKEKTLEQHWCLNSERLYPRAKGAKEINSNLDDIKSEIKAAFYQLIQEGVTVTAQSVKERFKGVDKPVLTLNDLIQYHRENELHKLAKGTAKNYNSTESYLAKFLKEQLKVSDIHLSLIDYSFIIRFDNFLRTCKPHRKWQPLNNNGIMKHMERFCKIVGLGVKHGWLKKHPFDLYQKSYDPYDSAFLEDFELKHFETEELPTESLRKVRDIFVFSCYTGLSYIEVKNLKISDIVQGIDGREWIMVRRQKSGIEVKLPLLEKASQVLDRYKGYPHEINDFSLLPVFSDQKINANLKIIAKILKIKKKLTFHVARHTFATTITLTNDVPLETVSKMLGHTKISTTQRYARVIEKKISQDMKQLSTKLQRDTSKEKKGKSYGHLKLV